MIGEGTALLETEQGFPIPILVSLSVSITVLSTHIRAFILHRPPESYRPVPRPDLVIIIGIHKEPGQR